MMFRVLSWTLQSCGLYFRTLYSGSLFLPKAAAEVLVEAGWKALESKLAWMTLSGKPPNLHTLNP